MPYFIFILPLIVLITSFLLRAASGPFWQYADVCYIYLLNGLVAFKGHAPFDNHHPGTPLQILIAVFIWVLNLGRTQAQATDQVLTNPEFYLYVVYVFLMISAFLTSVILALYIFEKTKDKTAALLSQLMGFCFLTLPSFNSGSFPVMPVVANVDPEPLFISIFNLFSLFLLKYYFAENKSQQRRYVMILAFICALGTAVKVNFFIIFLAALLIIGLRQKILFIVVYVISFTFCTLPILGSYPWIYQWLSGILTHSSRYASGSDKFIDWASFLKYFNYMMHSYWFFISSALGLWLWSLRHIIQDHKNKRAFFIWVLCSCSLLDFAFTAKHFSFHYLMPALGLFSLIFTLFYLDQKTKKETAASIAAAFIFIFIAVSFYYTVPYYKKLQVLSQDIRGLNDRLKTQYPSCTIIPSTTEDITLFLNQEDGLFRSDATIAKTESDDLARLYPNQYYFYSEEFTTPDPLAESYGIWDPKQRVFADDILTSCPCAIFTKFSSDFSQYPYQVRLVDQSKYLSAYLLVNSTEKAATVLFSQSMEAFNRGEYQQALLLGLKSRELNYEPRRQLEYILTVIYRDLLKSRGEPYPG